MVEYNKSLFLTVELYEVPECQSECVENDIINSEELKLKIESYIDSNT